MNTPPELESTYLQEHWDALARTRTCDPKMLVQTAELILSIRVDPQTEKRALDVRFSAYAPTKKVRQTLKYVEAAEERVPGIGLSRRITIQFDNRNGNEYRELFCHFAESICVAAFRGAPKSDTPKRIAETMELWSKAWPGRNGLSKERVIGLFGELEFLRRLARAVGIERAVEAWHGPKAGDHDFGLNDNAFEIKASTATRHWRVVIANLDQLSDTGLSALYLINVRLRKSGDQKHSLQELGEQLLAEAAAPDLRATLFKKMIRAGWMKATDDQKRDAGFRIGGIPSYKVQEGFPRILREDLKRFPAGVIVPRYMVDLSCCHKFEIPAEQFGQLLQSLNAEPAEVQSKVEIEKLLSSADDFEPDDEDDEDSK